MTIVIAKKNNGSITILSDTRVTYDKNLVPENRRNIRSNPQDGVLKTIIVYSDICISFAGDTKTACRIIKNFKEALSQNNPDFKWSPCKCAELLHQKIQDGDDAEFILCTTRESKLDPEQFIYKISKDIPPDQIRDTESAWIGDKEAFEAFQEIFHSDGNSSFESAFHSLVRRQKIPGIGDFVITATYDTKNGFHYNSRFWMEFTCCVPKDLAENEEVIVSTGCAAAGDYHEIYLESLYLCDPAVAIFFPLGRFGIFFSATEVLDNDGCGSVIKDVDVRGFMTEVAERYRIPLRGFEVKNDGICPVYSSLHEIDHHRMTDVAGSRSEEDGSRMPPDEKT